MIVDELREWSYARTQYSMYIELDCINHVRHMYNAYDTQKKR